MELSELTASHVAQRARLTQRVTLVGAATNLVLSVAQVVIGVVGHSQALIADAVHNFSDLVADILAYWTARHSHTAPDSNHPYGHRRFETAATLGISTLLFLAGIGIIWFAIERLMHPGLRVMPNPLTLYAAALSVLSKEALYHYVIQMARKLQSEMLRASAWHHRSDAVSSIIVLVGVTGTMLGFPYSDSVAATVVGLMIVKIGLDLATGAIQELVDTGLDPQRIQAIRETILAVGGVRDLHMLRTRRIGGIAVADVHVLVESHLSVSEGHMISLMVEQGLKQAIDELEDVTVHIDPEDDEIAPKCLNLPLRTEAMRRIGEAWQHLPQAQNCSNLVLHYLAGQINVDAYFPLGDSLDNIQAESLTQSLRQALRVHAEFGQLRVYFG